MVQQSPISNATFLEVAPFLLVDDVFASAEYYRDKLGFAFNTFFGDPPTFVILQRNTTRLMLRQVPAGARPAARPNVAKMPESLDVYFWVSDVDALAEEFARRGADIIDPPGNAEEDGARREMLVRDLNGYVLCFGRVLGWPE